MTSLASHAPPRAERRWAYFLDVDGTLLDFASTPDGAQVGAGTLALLRRLHDATGGAVALISGRALRDVERLFAGLTLAVAGQHGLEGRDADGTVTWMVEPGPMHDDLKRQLQAFVTENPSLILEDKGVSFAVHYRAAPQLDDLVRRRLESIHARLDATYVVAPGKQVLEIRPVGATKGDAIRVFMRITPFEGRLPVFVGDDVTDEAGFAMVNDRGGHSVKVGDGESIARWRLTDTAAVAEWLETALR